MFMGEGAERLPSSERDAEREWVMREVGVVGTVGFEPTLEGF